MRPLRPVGLQASGSVDQPVPLAPRRTGRPIADAITAGASSNSASTEPSMRGDVFEAQRAAALHLVPADHAGKLRSKSSMAG